VRNHGAIATQHMSLTKLLCAHDSSCDVYAHAGYRVPLALALSQHPLGAPSNAGFNISTMGTLETGPHYVPRSWLKHEGHPG
jgi:hypothetical protein